MTMASFSEHGGHHVLLSPTDGFIRKFHSGFLTDGWKNISVASIASDIPPFGSAPAAYIGIAVADTLAVNQSM